MYAFFVCLFVLIDQSGYCYFCSVMRSFCVLRDGQGIFLIYIYIYPGVGGRIFNTLQCSCEAVHPETGLGCKATVLPTVTNFNLNTASLSRTPHLGCKLNSFLVFITTNRVRTSEHNQFSWRQTWLKTNGLIFLLLLLGVVVFLESFGSTVENEPVSYLANIVVEKYIEHMFRL